MLQSGFEREWGRFPNALYLQVSCGSRFPTVKQLREPRAIIGLQQGAELTQALILVERLLVELWPRSRPQRQVCASRRSCRRQVTKRCFNDDPALRPVVELVPKVMLRHVGQVVVQCDHRTKCRQSLLFDLPEEVGGDLWLGNIPRTRQRRALIVQPLTPIERKSPPPLEQMYCRPLRSELGRIKHPPDKNAACEMPDGPDEYPSTHQNEIRVPLQQRLHKLFDLSRGRHSARLGRTSVTMIQRVSG